MWDTAGNTVQSPCIDDPKNNLVSLLCSKSLANMYDKLTQPKLFHNIKGFPPSDPSADQKLCIYFQEFIQSIRIHIIPYINQGTRNTPWITVITGIR